MNFGEMLSTGRNKLSLTFDKISKDLKIKVEYLQAFEKEKFEEMPQEPYCTGFLQIYAKYLELNESAVLEDYKIKRNAMKFVAENTFEKEKIKNDKIKGKVKIFQIWSFCSSQTECNKISLSGFEKIINNVFWVLVLTILGLSFLFFNKMFTQIEVADVSVKIQDFQQFDNYCLEILVLENVWLKIIVDDEVQISRVVLKDDIFRFSGNDNFRIILGSVYSVSIALNGSLIDVANKNTNNILLNSETIPDWIIE